MTQEFGSPSLRQHHSQNYQIVKELKRNVNCFFTFAFFRKDTVYFYFYEITVWSVIGNTDTFVDDSLEALHRFIEKEFSPLFNFV